MKKIKVIEDENIKIALGEIIDLGLHDIYIGSEIGAVEFITKLKRACKNIRKKE